MNLDNLRKPLSSLPREHQLAIILATRTKRLTRAKKSRLSKKRGTMTIRKYQLERVLNKMTKEERDVLRSKLDKGEL